MCDAFRLLLLLFLMYILPRRTRSHAHTHILEPLATAAAAEEDEVPKDNGISNKLPHHIVMDAIQFHVEI